MRNRVGSGAMANWFPCRQRSLRCSSCSYEKQGEIVTREELLDIVWRDTHAASDLTPLFHYWDWEGAEKDFRRAIQLNPNQAEAHRYLAQTLSLLGRHDEANIEIDHAIEINPISPSITMAQFSILQSRGDYDKALKRAEDFLRLEKANPLAKRAVATFSFHLGNHDRVIDIGEHLAVEDERQRFAFLSLLSSSYRKTNQIEKADEALRQLEQLAQSDTKALYSLAMNYAELDRTDDAVWALQKCFEQREERIVWVSVEPRFVNIRSDARLQDIMRKMRLV